ncbi:S100 calcium binding protein U [Thalassophryne amazonica]|uniref:S100 calcium binding protein U n=1 Tax=Thalassophryne amazonica TaxID=390379 RepID=UPI001471EDF5|nr:S100 calcium binding protein U [Thalassophryne amazonica]XP_034016382.1 S100 calcium binding protein U [Thalassophryne amazonica]
MEDAIKTVATVFVKSCKGKDGLTESNFQNLVKNQLSNIMTNADSKTAVSNLRQELDADQDKKVSFEEYMKLIGYLANALSEQRTKANETVQKAETEPQCTSSSQPENNQQGKEDAKEEPTKVETNAEAKPEPAKETEKPAVAAGTVSVGLPDKPAAATVEMVISVVPTNENIKVEESEKAEIAKEKLATAVEEEGEGEKTDEATS